MNKIVLNKIITSVLTLVCVAVISLPAMKTASAKSTRDVVDGVQTKMVKIFGAGGFENLKSYGTGFLVSSDGHIVTVWSSVLDSPKISVILNNGLKFEAKVVGAEPELDVAVIKIDATDLPYFDLKKSPAPQAGTRILGFSNMFKVATGNEPVSVLRGIISSMTKLTARRGAYDVPYEGQVMIVDAITNNPGAAGGVVTSIDGKLLGMIGRELRDRRSNLWINYSTPIVALRQTISDIIAGKVNRKPKDKFAPVDLVINYTMTDFGVVMVPDVLVRTPAFVDSVLPASLASRSGLKPDDLILFVNEDQIHSIDVLRKVVGKARPGDLLKITYRRGNKLHTAEWDVMRKAKLEK